MEKLVLLAILAGLAWLALGCSLESAPPSGPDDTPARRQREFHP